MLHSDALSRLLSFYLSLSLTGMRLSLSLFYIYCWLCPSFLFFLSSSCFVDVIPHFLITQAKNRHPTDNKGPAKQSDTKKKNIYYSVCPSKGPHKKGRCADKEALPHCRCLTQTEEKETGHVQERPRSACCHCSHVFQNACFTTQKKPGSATLCFVQATNEATTLNLPPRPIPFTLYHAFILIHIHFFHVRQLHPADPIWNGVKIRLKVSLQARFWYR